MKSGFVACFFPVVFLFGLFPQAIKLPQEQLKGTQPTALTPTGEQPFVPARNSPRWYYERALVLQVQEKPAHAIVELYRALESSKTAREPIEAKLAQKNISKTEQAEQEQLKQELAGQEIEIQHLLGVLHLRNQRTVDAITALETVVSEPNSENILARLELSQAYLELKAWDKVDIHAKRLIGLLKINTEQVSNATREVRQWLPRVKQGGEPHLKEAFKTMLSAVEDALFDNPVLYRELTLGRKIRDPFVYAELIRLFMEQENMEETQGMLMEAIRVRSGFFPIAYIGLGEFQEITGQKAEQAKNAATALENYTAALKSYETALEQLKSLNFSPEKGEIDVEHIIQLRKKIDTLQTLPKTTSK